MARLGAVRAWVSVVIRKCEPPFPYLAKNSFINLTSIILSNILFIYPGWIIQFLIGQEFFRRFSF